ESGNTSSRPLDEKTTQEGWCPLFSTSFGGASPSTATIHDSSFSARKWPRVAGLTARSNACLPSGESSMVRNASGVDVSDRERPLATSIATTFRRRRSTKYMSPGTTSSVLCSTRILGAGGSGTRGSSAAITSVLPSEVHLGSSPSDDHRV